MTEAITIEKMMTYTRVPRAAIPASPQEKQQPELPPSLYRMSCRPGRNAMLRLIGVMAVKD